MANLNVIMNETGLNVLNINVLHAIYTIISRRRIIYKMNLLNNITSLYLLCFRMALSACDFSSSIYFLLFLLAQHRLFGEYLNFQVILSVQLIKNNFEFLFGCLPIMKASEIKLFMEFNIL